MNATTPTTQTFRALVADVAARAKARLPQAVNGRVESAVKLVLGHDVEPQEDGSILVGSSSDPLKQYRLEGSTCTCLDFAHGKGIDGWCQHRIAAGIHKRVGELLAVEPAPAPAQEALGAPQPAPAALPEAPASVNCHLMIDGRQVQLTLRDTDETRLLQRLHAVLAQYPVDTPAPAQPLSPQQHNAAAMHRPVTGFCPVHNVPMRWNEGKDGRKGWWSHRSPEGWCKGA